MSASITPITTNRRDIGHQLQYDHRQIETLFDQLQTQIANRDALLPALAQLVLAHFAALNVVLPELTRRIVYPPLVPQHQAREAQTRQLLAELDRTVSANLEFDAILQSLLDTVMDQLDDEIDILQPAIDATLPLDRRTSLGLAFERARRTFLTTRRDALRSTTASARRDQPRLPGCEQIPPAVHSDSA